MKKKILFLAVWIFSTFLVFPITKKDITKASLSNIEKLVSKKKLANFIATNGSNALQVAIQVENFLVAEWLAENEICDPNHQNVFGRTAINDAIDSGNIDILKILIEHGARIKKVRYLQNPVVQTVVTGNLEMAQFFRELGEDYTVVSDGKNMIHLAVMNFQTEMIPFLVESGAEINAVDDQNLTPLLIAIKNDEPEQISVLIANGAEIEKRNSEGQTPIFFAIENFSDSAVQTLIDKKANIEAKDSKERTPFLFAYEVDNVNAAGKLLNANATFPKQQIFTALNDKKLSYLPLLLKAGADITIKDSAGRNALHVAAKNCDSSSLSLFLEKPAAVSIINQKDLKGRTPLILACGTGSGFTNGVALLLNAGASTEERDDNGNTAIHASILTNTDLASKELSQIILQKNSGLLNAKNNMGQTPLMLSLQNKKPETSDYILELHPDVLAKDNLNNTSLHYACSSGMEDSVKKIVSLGADLNVLNSQNESPICIASKKQYENISDNLLKISGINIDTKDSKGKSARNYLADLYNLRHEQSSKRWEKYFNERQEAWNRAASARDSKYKLENENRERESENRSLQRKIDSAKEGTNTSGWSNKIFSNDMAIAANNLSITLENITISDENKKADECTKKMDAEMEIQKTYIAKMESLNNISRQ